MKFGMMVFLIAMLSAGCAVADLTLVQDGQPTCAIVLAAEPTASAKEAAVALQFHLREMSGAQIPIVAEGEVPEGFCVLVGDSSLTAGLGLNSDDFDLEQIVVKVQGDNLVIIGDDAKPGGTELRGTLWAAYTFLEEVLGVRWLWPGELGTVIPKRKTVTVPADLNISYTPPLLQRKIRNIQWNERVQRGLDKLGFTKEQFDAVHNEGKPWFARHRIGGSFQGSYGHAYGKYWERFGAEHPDWFALQPDGTRDQSKSPGRARLCVSNQGLIEQIARDKIEQLKANPDLDCASISPNDGGPLTFCTCPNCEAWDAPDGEIIEYWWPETGHKQHVSLSDRYVKFYSAIARLVAQECPGRYLGAYAYSAYRTVPVAAELEPNVIIGFVGLNYLNRESHDADMQRWNGWAEKASRTFWRPNLLGGGMSFPVNFAKRLGTDLAMLVDSGLTVTDFDCCYQHWALKGLTYYVLAEMLWDPDADPDAIIDDYCQAGWGPAAGEVRQYFDALERLTDQVYESSEYFGRKKSTELLAGYYTDEFLAELQGHLDAAREKAAADEAILARIDFLQTAIDYARVHRDYRLARAAVRAGDETQKEAMEAGQEALEAFYQDLGISWAINSPYLKFYGF